jgi:ribosome modulation factor
MYDKNRKAKLDRIVDEGYNARRQGKKCNSPYGRQLERAAWEIGWRSV